MPNGNGEIDEGRHIDVSIVGPVAVEPAPVSLQRTAAKPTPDQPLWTAIRNRTQAINFKRYYTFINNVLGVNPGGNTSLSKSSTTRCDPMQTLQYGTPSVEDGLGNLAKRPTIHGLDAYNLLKLATEAFLIFESGVVIDPIDSDESNLEEAEARRLEQPVTLEGIQQKLSSYLVGASTLPYLDRIATQILGLSRQHAEDLPYREEILRNRLTHPSLLELIWSYWHEEGMLVQTLNAISLRFQNKRMRDRDPLANLELDPLRPLNNIIWGFIQDEYNRLSLQRRAYEYDHHYGFMLVGKAVPQMASADSRSRFVGAFHNLLYRTAMFYRDDDDTTVVADAFALLNALREVHIILAEGAHNQFGDLPWTARKEMLIMQWILARPEIREFLRGRYMVPYQEAWMGAVDDMKRLQGWSDVTITHFHELAIFGEQLLLSIRYGDWINLNDQNHARNWARYWRPEIQRYVHAYHAVTGVDLAADIVDTRLAEDRYLQPSVHLSRRLVAPRNRRIAAPRNRRALPQAPVASEFLADEGVDYVALPAAPQRRLPRDHGEA